MNGNTLHILNGDCAFEGWREAGLAGSALVWRENYLQGAIPRTSDIEEFSRLRAGELNKMVPARPVREISQELVAASQTLLKLGPEDTLVLWFDVCPFDRAMLSRLLYLLAGKEQKPAVSLVFEDTVWSTESFIKYYPAARLLNEQDLRYGATQWREYLAGSPAEGLLSSWRS